MSRCTHTKNLIKPLLLTLALCAQSAWSVAPVEVVGLFRDRAVIRVNDGEVMLRVGETKKGVTLLSADANKASVRYAGERYELGLSNRVAGGYREIEKVQVVISSDRRGQYQVRGAINNQFTNFLVDTGASVVALSSELATSMNIDYTAGKQGAVETAQGRVGSRLVTLDELVVGSIKVYNIPAAVIEGDFPTLPLLGMSFLREVSMQESEGVLTLTQRR
jgi:aspartyl protease family protein